MSLWDLVKNMMTIAAKCNVTVVLFYYINFIAVFYCVIILFNYINITHPIYSPYLVLFSFQLFLNVKITMKGT